MKNFFAPLFIIAIIVSCSNTTPKQTMKNTNSEDLKTAYFASGCFWCSELVFENLNGVTNVVSGYAGGHTKNPTYQSSNTGTTGHAEAIKVTYNPKKITFTDLIDVYFASQDATQVNGQGNDIGAQYRSIIFYQNETEKEMILTKKSALAKKLNTPIAAEIQEFKQFWIAEDYHQDYAKLHPNHGYVKEVSVPRLQAAQRACPLLYKK